MDALVDSSVLVDLYNGYAPAVTWLQANRNLVLGITQIAWMEVIAGAQNKSAQRPIVRFLNRFPVVHLTSGDQNWAAQQYMSYVLSHGIGILDCLIAAPSYRLQLPLYTLNLKHFAPLLGTLVQQPY